MKKQTVFFKIRDYIDVAVKVMELQPSAGQAVGQGKSNYYIFYLNNGGKITIDFTSLINSQ